VGIWRLFELLDELGLPAEAQLNAGGHDVAPTSPRGSAPAATRSWATADQLGRAGHLPEDQERTLIEQATATIARHEGARPVGWMSPWLSNSPVTMDLLQEAGYRYVMDWTMDDQPIWLRTRKGRILAVPYPIEVNDTRGSSGIAIPRTSSRT